MTVDPGAEKRSNGGHEDLIPSDFLLNVFPADFTVAENLGEESASDGLTAMNGNHRAPTVGVTEKVVASLDPNEVKTKVTKRFDELGARECRKCAHAMTATRWTPTN